MIEGKGSSPPLGATVEAGGTRFTLWAPAAEEVELLLEGRGRDRLEREASGLHSLYVPRVGAGTRYRYQLDGNIFPDPVSRYQPEGVHGPSQVVDPSSYDWRHPFPPEGPVAGAIYELHIGTFTRAGSFGAACQRLPYLAELGVETIEIMPVHDFPGRWNWGYDPASYFAPSRAYGTPDELRCLVDDAHGLGLTVLLDVVYNHFGPDGAYWPAFDPHTFTNRHHTPWGDAVDYDGTHSAGVRRFVIENALMWLTEYRFDGLRLDATFAIIDDGPCHLLAQLTCAVGELPGPERLLVAEDPRNSRVVLLSHKQGGLGLSAVWADDLHHQLRVRLAGDQRGYFRDFDGSTEQIAVTLQHNWFYRGHHSKHHGRPRGTSASDLPPHRFVTCIQNHDQVGNRPDGARLNHEVRLPAYRAASALLLFAPQTPLLFMGQEWAAGTKFLFFTDHEGELGKRVSEGRRQEFVDFEFGDAVADPQDEGTFRKSRLDWEELEREPHAGTLRFYRQLLRLRHQLNGPIEIVELRQEGLSLRRGRHLLLVAFEGGASFGMPPGAATILSSEEAEFETEPEPPQLSGDRLVFRRAGALLFELTAEADQTSAGVTR